MVVKTCSGTVLHLPTALLAAHLYCLNGAPLCIHVPLSASSLYCTNCYMLLFLHMFSSCMHGLHIRIISACARLFLSLWTRLAFELLEMLSCLLVKWLLPVCWVCSPPVHLLGSRLTAEGGAIWQYS